MTTLRTIAGKQVPAIGLGCMNLSHAYGTPPSPAAGAKLLAQAFDLGVRHFDTAALYGFGKNEKLVGAALKPYRSQIFLASKCGMTGVDGKRVIDGRPATLMATLDTALANLQTDFIDLYYLHRFDKRVPVEDSVGALSRMVEAGKIGAIGLSEVSAQTLQKAHAVHPVAALQTEYSLWTRNAEIAVLKACRDLGVAFVAFSPLGRGFLTDAALAPGDLPDTDIRRGMPRFQEPHFTNNQTLRDNLGGIARRLGVTRAQLALAWLLHQGDHILPIPGTTSLAHLEENQAAASIKLNTDTLRELDTVFNALSVSGPRYPEAAQREIDTENFT